MGPGIRPSNTGGQEDGWNKVLRRREKKGVAPPNQRPGTTKRVVTGERGNGDKTAKPQKRKEPKTAVVTITCADNKYGEVIKEAKSKIVLAELNIGDGMRCKRAVTGACLFEIPGPDGQEKARSLEQRLQDVFRDRSDVKVARPKKTAELRVTDLDDSVGGLDVVGVISNVGGCSVSDIRAGGINRAPNGLGTLWLRCPLSAANRVSQMGRIQVGWCSAKVSLLEMRPLQCYRCLEVGHVQANCRNKKDRRTQCYRCGQDGHIARECEATSPRCTVCAVRANRLITVRGARPAPT